MARSAPFMRYVRTDIAVNTAANIARRCRREPAFFALFCVSRARAALLPRPRNEHSAAHTRITRHALPCVMPTAFARTLRCHAHAAHYLLTFSARLTSSPYLAIVTLTPPPPLYCRYYAATARAASHATHIPTSRPYRTLPHAIMQRSRKSVLYRRQRR